MGKIAINKFFTNQREANARENAYYARLEEEMNNPPPIVVDTTRFDEEVEHFDFLLKRNWFLDEESLVDFLIDADKDVFQEIINRIKSYPYDVRQTIYTFLPLPIGNVRLNIREITDEDMAIREIKAYEAAKKILNDSWENYKRENNLEPPVGYLDSEMDDMYGELQAAKKELDSVKKKSLTGRYVSPGMRDKVVSDDPRVLAVTKKIEALENGISIQNKYIEQERDVWYTNKRNEFEKQQMLSL
jgi:hypothetical protein